MKKQQGKGGTEPALRKLFVDEVRDIYWAEKALVKALGKLQKACTTDKLRATIQEHQTVTETHVSRLEQVFELIDEKARGKKCEAMEGLLKESDSIVEDTEDGSATRDVGIIMAAQKVEHYEIATYGSLATLARTLNLADVAKILEQTLSEEKEADQLLTQIAENDINYEAIAERKNED